MILKKKLRVDWSRVEEVWYKILVNKALAFFFLFVAVVVVIKYRQKTGITDPHMYYDDVMFVTLPV